MPSGKPVCIELLSIDASVSFLKPHGEIRIPEIEQKKARRTLFRGQYLNQASR